MKAEFELSLNTETGLPEIKFIHWENVNSIEQSALKIFIDSANKKGIKLIYNGGVAVTGSPQSSNSSYKIIINE